ncbi:MAG: metal-dependent transcriptional regulator [Saprospiraceae bacterium]|nr:metal-dependent transcriptional regulator [Saprospiraceae bacterium]
MSFSTTEENYLKAIFKLSEKSGDRPVLTNHLAAEMQIAAASVTDMIRRLAEKQLIEYEKYKGVQLTAEGQRWATYLIRKHRLWEVFLLEKLGFAWDEVHEMAEQLEHIQGDELVNRLDRFLGFPRYDPHGDPIPDEHGRWEARRQSPLSDVMPGQVFIVTGVQDHSTTYLQYLDHLGIALGSRIEPLERLPYDHSMRVKLADGPAFTLSEKAALNLLVMSADEQTTQ